MTLRHNEIFYTCISEIEHVIICSLDYYIADMYYGPICIRSLRSQPVMNVRHLIKRK